MTTTTKKENSFPFSTVGALGVLAVGGYILWQNRFKVQKFLESQGIDTPWMTGNAGEAIASGAAKAVGAVQNEIKPNALSNLSKDLDKTAMN